MCTTYVSTLSSPFPSISSRRRLANALGADVWTGKISCVVAAYARVYQRKHLRTVLYWCVCVVVVCVFVCLYECVSVHMPAWRVHITVLYCIQHGTERLVRSHRIRIKTYKTKRLNPHVRINVIRCWNGLFLVLPIPKSQKLDVLELLFSQFRLCLNCDFICENSTRLRVHTRSFATKASDGVGWQRQQDTSNSSIQVKRRDGKIEKKNKRQEEKSTHITIARRVKL